MDMKTDWCCWHYTQLGPGAFPLKEPVILGARGAKAGRQRQSSTTSATTNSLNFYRHCFLQQEERYEVGIWWMKLIIFTIVCKFSDGIHVRLPLGMDGRSAGHVIIAENIRGLFQLLQMFV